MKFCWTTIGVMDMEASLRFYQNIVGLSLARRMKHADDQEFAFLGAGETQVELIWNANKTAVQTSPDISMGFETKSLDDLTVLLKKEGIPVVAGPFSPGPGVAFLFVLDPDGYKIQFIEFKK